MKVQATFQIDKILGPEILKQLQDAHKALEAAKRVAVEAFGKTPEGSLIYKTNPSGEDAAITFNSNFSAMTIGFNHGLLVSAEERFIPETVLNTMLHSKLLTDSEKKQLLVGQGYLKAEPTGSVRTFANGEKTEDDEIPF